jgi:hypothetical protein
VSYLQATQDSGAHTSQLRDWVKKFADDPQQGISASSLKMFEAMSRAIAANSII